MPSKRKKNEIYVVVTPEKQITVHATAQDAADIAKITRNTLEAHLKKSGSYSKRDYVIVSRTIPKKRRRGKELF